MRAEEVIGMRFSECRGAMRVQSLGSLFLQGVPLGGPCRVAFGVT